MKSQQQKVLMSPHHPGQPPPPYKSPPSSYFPPQVSPSPGQPPHLSPNSVQIAPNVTLIKKQKSPIQQTSQPPRQPSPPSYQESSQCSEDSLISPPAAPSAAPPPPYVAPKQNVSSGSGPPKLPSYSLDELKDLPGANLKKSSVDLNAYIAAMARNTHPAFVNEDNFAERCLACIVRKIKTNLPTLRALLDSSRQGDTADPGCVLIPRMKDGRITIARPGGGGGAGGGTRKIHPHLALVQIFRDPHVTNHNSLVSVPHCAAPFIARGGGGDPECDTEMVCINPMHYYTDTSATSGPGGGKTKSPAAVKRRLSAAAQLSSSNILLTQMEAERQRREQLQQGKPRTGQTAGGGKKQTQSVESDDFLSDSDDDGIDWVKRWEEDRVKCDNINVQEFKVDQLVTDIKVMTVNTKDDGSEELTDTEVKVLEKLKVIEDFKNLFNGNYDLNQLKNLQKVKPKKQTNKSIKPPRKKPGPKPKKKLGETWISGGGPVTTSSKVKQAVSQVVTSRMEQKAESKLDSSDPREDKDEAVIHNLLEDIKGSFENQFDMDLDTFDAAEVGSDFGMGAPFNLGSLDVLSKESFSEPAILDRSIASGSSDAMFGGGAATAGLTIPEFGGRVPEWPGAAPAASQEAEGKEADTELALGGESLMDDLSSFVSGQTNLNLRDAQQFYNQQPQPSEQFQFNERALEHSEEEQQFPDASFLPSGTMSQDQFFNIFDD